MARQHKVGDVGSMGAEATHGRRCSPAGRANRRSATDRAGPGPSALALGLPWAHRGWTACRDADHRPALQRNPLCPNSLIIPYPCARRDDVQSGRVPQPVCLAADRPRAASTNDCSTDLRCRPQTANGNARPTVAQTARSARFDANARSVSLCPIRPGNRMRGQGQAAQPAVA
jgi:hypothetical protein